MTPIRIQEYAQHAYHDGNYHKMDMARISIIMSGFTLSAGECLKLQKPKIKYPKGMAGIIMSCIEEEAAPDEEPTENGIILKHLLGKFGWDDIRRYLRGLEI